MKVRVKLFAVVREIAGRAEVQLVVGDHATVADVRQALLNTFPQMQAVLPHARWAMDAEFVADDTVVDSSSEIALIPPVSGG